MRKVTMLAVLAAVAAAGCGGGGSGGIANFVGDWHYSAGTLSQTCPGATLPPTNLSGILVSVSRTGNPGEIEFLSDFDGCARYLNVVGNTTSMTSYAGPCTDEAVDSNNEHYVLTITPLTEVLTYRGGRMMSESATNSLRFLYDDNTYTDCTSTIPNASLY